jgi:phosphoribosyl 1,2-cyclic phosphodiesterase
MDFIKFLGTAGARIVVARQVRASGGIWLSLQGTNLLIDPGPGSLVRCLAARPKLDPTTLDGIVLSHKHLDHAADINVMMEAISLGGHQKKGIVLAPRDAFSGSDPIIYKYVRPYVSKLEILKEKGKYKIGHIRITAPVKHIHGVETYGLTFTAGGQVISYITDTRYFPALTKKYRGDILIISVLRVEPCNLDHLCLADVKKIIRAARPKTAILTHFGVAMIKAKPWQIAAELSAELKSQVIAASDGLFYNLEQ